MCSICHIVCSLGLESIILSVLETFIIPYQAISNWEKQGQEASGGRGEGMYEGEKTGGEKNIEKLEK